MSRDLTLTVNVTAPQTTLLGQAAASLTSPKSVAFINGTINYDGTTGGESIFQSRVGGGSICEYSGRSVWNPILKKAGYFGGSHNTSGFLHTCKVVSYIDATNTWVENYSQGLGDDPDPAMHFNHSYHSTTIDTTTGTVYYRVYNEGNRIKQINPITLYTEAFIATPFGVWADIAPLQYFPERHSVLLYELNYGLYEYSISSGTWAQRAGMVPGVTNGNGILGYDASKGCIIYYGGANNGLRFNANGTTATITNPGLLFKTAADGGGVVMTTDPVSGKAVVFNQTRDVWEFNGTTFVNTGYTLPASVTVNESGAGGMGEIMVCPVSTYGVILMAGYNYGTNRIMCVYRHT
jgi:hypothetical protein